MGPDGDEQEAPFPSMLVGPMTAPGSSIIAASTCLIEGGGIAFWRVKKGEFE